MLVSRRVWSYLYPWQIHVTGIFTYIYHKNQPNVSKKDMGPMSPMGYEFAGGSFFFDNTCLTSWDVLKQCLNFHRMCWGNFSSQLVLLQTWVAHLPFCCLHRLDHHVGRRIDASSLQCFTPWKMNMVHLQITNEKKGKWSEPNLHEDMFHVNLQGGILKKLFILLLGELWRVLGWDFEPKRRVKTQILGMVSWKLSSLISQESGLYPSGGINSFFIFCS